MRRGLLVLAGLLVTACAGYSITGPDGQDGYVVYEPEPYVLVKPVYAGTGVVTGYSAEITWLPNRSHPYRVRAWGGLGKGNFTFTYKDGWMLTDLTADIDNTQILTAIVDLLPQGLRKERRWTEAP